MSRRPSLNEQLAAEARDANLADIVAAAGAWDLNVVKRAVIAHGRILGEFSANDFRHVLPEQGTGFVGAACRGLAKSGVIRETGDFVASTLPGTHGHRIAVYRLAPAQRSEAA